MSQLNTWREILTVCIIIQNFINVFLCITVSLCDWDWAHHRWRMEAVRGEHWNHQDLRGSPWNHKWTRFSLIITDLTYWLEFIRHIMHKQCPQIQNAPYCPEQPFNLLWLSSKNKGTKQTQRSPLLDLSVEPNVPPTSVPVHNTRAIA